MNEFIPNRSGFIVLLDHDATQEEVHRLMEVVKMHATVPGDWMVFSRSKLADPEELKKLLAQLPKGA